MLVQPNQPPIQPNQPTFLQASARNCKRLACDIAIYTLSGATIGTAISAAAAYPAWNESRQINAILEKGVKETEEVLKQDPSLDFMLSLHLYAIASQRNEKHTTAVQYMTAGPVIGAAAGFFIGSVLGTARLFRSIFNL